MNVEEQVEAWDGSGDLPPLYTRTADGALNVWHCWVNGPDVCVRWGQMGGAQQEASFRCLPKNEGRANATTAEVQAIKEAIAKWKKQVKKKYHWDRDKALVEQRSRPMLAKDYEDHGKKLVYPAYAQPKYDGLRCLSYPGDAGPFLQSRGGDPYKVAHIQQELSKFFEIVGDEYTLDGELYTHGVSLQTLNSYVKTPQENTSFLSYMVYDVIVKKEPEMPYYLRRLTLDKLFRSMALHNNWFMVRAVPDISVNSAEEVVEAHKTFVSRGFEGAMIRSASHPYRYGYRSDGLLKVKAWQDAEFKIVSYTVGKGKFANVPIFTCVTGEGVQFDCAPNGTDAERAKMLKEAPNLIGELLTVQFFDWTDDRKPHYPRGIAIRSRSDL